MPGHLKRYISKFGWPDERVEEWLRRPVPILAYKCVLKALEDGDLQAVNDVVLRTGDALGITDDLS